MDLKSTYNKIASDWAKDHSGDATWWIDETEKFISLLPKNGIILDLGCGPGEKSKYFTKKGFKVIGIDFSDEMIKIAKKENPNETFFIRDIKKPLDLNESFDGIFALAVLLHISKNDIVNVIKNIIINLKLGGFLYITVKEKKENGVDEAIIKENDYGYEYERYFSYYTLEDIRKYLADADLTVIHEAITYSKHSNWIQIIARK